MAEYLVAPERAMAGIRVKALSARRASEFGAYILKDNGKLNGWTGGIRRIHVRNIVSKKRDEKAWVFDVMLSQPGSRFDVVGEVRG